MDQASQSLHALVPDLPEPEIIVPPPPMDEMINRNERNDLPETNNSEMDEMINREDSVSENEDIGDREEEEHQQADIAGVQNEVEVALTLAGMSEHWAVFQE
eukprot:309029_1